MPGSQQQQLPPPNFALFIYLFNYYFTRSLLTSERSSRICHPFEHAPNFAATVSYSVIHTQIWCTSASELCHDGTYWRLASNRLNLTGHVPAHTMTSPSITGYDSSCIVHRTCSLPLLLPHPSYSVFFWVFDKGKQAFQVARRESQDIVFVFVVFLDGTFTSFTNVT